MTVVCSNPTIDQWQHQHQNFLEQREGKRNLGESKMCASRAQICHFDAEIVKSGLI